MFRLLIVLFLGVVSIGCNSSVEPSVAVTPEPRTQSSTTESLGNSAIEKFDFKNFTYMGPADYPETFTLNDGEKSYVPNGSRAPEEGYSLDNVYYSDLTGDGEKDAVVVISIQTGGSAMPHLIFVYAANGPRPKEIWKFATGDRADGGLKNISFQDGNLVVELFGNDKYVNGDWKSTIPKTEGLCCPTIFTTTEFHWDGKQFVISEQPKVFPMKNENINGEG
jgi:hypothetical protein